MPGFYRFCADGLVMIHAMWVAFIVFGLIGILLGYVRRWNWVRHFWFRVVHLGMIGIVVFEAVLGIPCPLTVWEDQLRRAAGETVDQGSFVGRIVHDLLFYDLPPWGFTVIYCVFGAVVLATMLLVPPRRPERRGGNRVSKRGVE